MYREMKSETPEWKKEIAEKVKAYGERKKRLITPPGPIKETADLPEQLKEPSVPVYAKTVEPAREEKVETVLVEKPAAEAKSVPPLQPAPEPLIHPSVEVWTADLETVPPFDASLGLIAEEPASAGAPYASRRLVAGIIDHTILIVLMIVFMGAYSLLTGEAMEAQIASPWRVTLPAFLICHCIYFLYFFRATRPTPGMVFLSLELRDPGSSVIPFGKVLVRWLFMVIVNVFNFVPVLLGKKFLVMDLISTTEMRSFK